MTEMKFINGKKRISLDVALNAMVELKNIAFLIVDIQLLLDERKSSIGMFK